MQKSKISAVMVTFNPDIDTLISNIKQASMQVEKLFIINNSDSELILPLDFPGVDLTNLGHNMGIGYAQNVGIRRAALGDFEFILLLDQDTYIPNSYVDNVLNLYTDLVERGWKVGLVGASIFDLHTKSKLTPLCSFHAITHRHAFVPDILSSGSFIPMTTFEVAGLLDEALFIDLVDFEFCWRVSSKGLKVVRHNEVMISHQLGESRKKVFGKSLIGVPSPFRHYFQFRNTIYLIIQKRTTTYWALKAIFKMLFKITLYPIILPQGLLRAKFMIRGLRDGLNGTQGPLINH